MPASNIETALLECLQDLFDKIKHISDDRSAAAIPDTSSRIKIDVSTLSLQFRGKTLSPLTAKEIQILSQLNNAPEKSMPRDEIVRRVWKTVKVSPKTLDVHIFNLRRKLTPLGIEIVFRHPNVFRLETATPPAPSPEAGMAFLADGSQDQLKLA